MKCVDIRSGQDSSSGRPHTHTIMLTEEEYCSAVGEGFSYENDLQLAAELGKTLLERNRDLEIQLQQEQEIQSEQANEIDLLTKQLDILRNVNESRMRIYEEVDRNLQDIEKGNDHLRLENRTLKEKIKSLNETVECLELKADELQSKIQENKIRERERHRQEKRTWSVPSLTEVSDLRTFGFGEFTGFPTEPWEYPTLSSDRTVRDLKDMVKGLKAQLELETRKRKNMDIEISSLLQENTELTNKTATLEKEKEQLKTSVGTCSVPVKYFRLCRKCGGSISDIEEAEFLEHDDLEEIPHGELVRLKNGGSAYGSRESLNMIGLEADDVTDDIESCQEIFASASAALESREKSVEGEFAVPGAQVSLLGELEEQYRTLVKRYECLIEAKNKRTSAKDIGTQDNLDKPNSDDRPGSLDIKNESKTTTRRSGIDFRSPLDPTEGHFENGPPEYKRLFKEIFQTLRRSVVYEDDSHPRDGAKDSNSSITPKAEDADTQM